MPFVYVCKYYIYVYIGIFLFLVAIYKCIYLDMNSYMHIYVLGYNLI